MPERKNTRVESPPLAPLKAAPRGLLLHYVLHSIALKPRHGYEILHDIQGKTDGAWRPGAGSVYPVLKRLLADGFIRADGGPAQNRRVYSITPKGVEEMERGDAFAGPLPRWNAMRRLYFDMLDPAGMGAAFAEGSKRQLEMAKALLDARGDALTRSEMDFMLREYSVNLERQLDWTQGRLGGLRARADARRRP